MITKFNFKSIFLITFIFFKFTHNFIISAPIWRHEMKSCLKWKQEEEVRLEAKRKARENAKIKAKDAKIKTENEKSIV